METGTNGFFGQGMTIWAALRPYIGPLVFEIVKEVIPPSGMTYPDPDSEGTLHRVLRERMPRVIYTAACLLRHEMIDGRKRAEGFFPGELHKTPLPSEYFLSLRFDPDRNAMDDCHGLRIIGIRIFDGRPLERPRSGEAMGAGAVPVPLDIGMAVEQGAELKSQEWWRNKFDSNKDKSPLRKKETRALYKEFCRQIGKKEPSDEEIELQERGASIYLRDRGIKPRVYSGGRYSGTSHIVTVMKSIPREIIQTGIRAASPAEFVGWLKASAPRSKQLDALLLDRPQKLLEQLFAQLPEILRNEIKVEADRDGFVSIGAVKH